ncbi:transposase [Streptomyces sp. SID13666]|nr:transposase [Streptomyces sp. SID13666]NEA75794.1 transposase [Streptomyces sp. SID13588]
MSDAEWERLRSFLPVSNGRCGRWRDHRQVIDGILHRVRTGVQWRDLPERFGPWKTVYERHRLWSADGTWERLLQQVQAAADATPTSPRAGRRGRQLLTASPLVIRSAWRPSRS